MSTQDARIATTAFVAGSGLRLDSSWQVLLGGRVHGDSPCWNGMDGTPSFPHNPCLRLMTPQLPIADKHQHDRSIGGPTMHGLFLNIRPRMLEAAHHRCTVPTSRETHRLGYFPNLRCDSPTEVASDVRIMSPIIRWTLWPSPSSAVSLPSSTWRHLSSVRAAIFKTRSWLIPCLQPYWPTSYPLTGWRFYLAMEIFWESDTSVAWQQVGRQG